MTDPRLKIYFSPHLKTAFNSNFDTLFAWARIIAMESAARNGEDETEKEYNDLSAGIVTPEDAYQSKEHSVFSEFAKSLAEKLYRSGRIVLVEKPPVSLQEYFDLHFLLHGLARENWNKGFVNEALGKLGDYLQKSALQYKKRDDAYAIQLEGILDQHRVNVLAIRGPFHSLTLPPILTRLGIDYESHYAGRYCASYADGILLKLIQGEKMTDEDVLRVHIEEDLLSQCPEAERHAYSARKKARESAESMTIEDLWKRANRNQ